MPRLSQDRLIRKEVALGSIRERTWPENHVGLSLFAPFMNVQSDDVIFEYVQDSGSGLVPARAEDAEAEMAMKEDTLGEGRASIIDWAIKDHYSASDVTRYREAIYLNGKIGTNLPLSIGSMTEDFQRVLARDTALRQKKLYNRMEWLIHEALWNGEISYNDGKIKFLVDYDRPSAQSTASVTPWSGTSADPIGDILDVVEYMDDTYGVTIDRAVVSKKILRNILNSDKFAARSGLAGATGSKPVDPRYLIDGWGYEAATAVVERATGVTLIPFDSVYRTRSAGSTSLTNHRFSPEDKVLFLPSQASINELDDMIGFGKTLTSPHPAGNWAPGFYEWEKDLGQDPWGYEIGTGIKAFPVFPHLELTYVLKVLAS